MIIKLTPPQITEYWENIKYSMVHGDLIEESHRQIVLNETLQALLSETAQCFMRIDPEDRKIIAVMITRIKISDRSFDKYLYIQCIFSYRKVKNIDWQKDWNFVGEFAHSNDCKYIIADSSNSQIFNLMNNLGAQEIYRTFKFEL